MAYKTRQKFLVGVQVRYHKYSFTKFRTQNRTYTAILDIYTSEHGLVQITDRNNEKYRVEH